MRLLVAFVLLCACSRVEPLANGEFCRRTEVLDRGLLPVRVQWVEAEGDQRTLDLWCETVGPAVLRAKPERPDTSAADSIAIVSWNTHVGGADIEQFVRDLRAGRLTGDSVKHFVLLLQEVYRSSDSVPPTPRVATPQRILEHPPRGQRHDIVATASALGLSLLYVPSMRNGAQVREDRGNAILSTFELDEPKGIDLPFERQRRVVATGRIRGRGSKGEWDLAVASVHFDNWSRVERITASVGPGRYRQAYGLVQALKEEERVAVGGDFNTWAIGAFERALPLLRSAFDDSPPPPPGITYVKGDVRRRIDYLFFRLPDGWRARYERVDSRYGSDHYPLLGWVAF